MFVQYQPDDGETNTRSPKTAGRRAVYLIDTDEDRSGLFGGDANSRILSCNADALLDSRRADKHGIGAKLERIVDEKLKYRYERVAISLRERQMIFDFDLNAIYTVFVLPASAQIADRLINDFAHNNRTHLNI